MGRNNFYPFRIQPSCCYARSRVGSVSHILTQAVCVHAQLLLDIGEPIEVATPSSMPGLKSKRLTALATGGPRCRACSHSGESQCHARQRN